MSMKNPDKGQDSRNQQNQDPVSYPDTGAFCQVAWPSLKANPSDNPHKEVVAGAESSKPRPRLFLLVPELRLDPATRNSVSTLTCGSLRNRVSRRPVPNRSLGTRS